MFGDKLGKIKKGNELPPHMMYPAMNYPNAPVPQVQPQQPMPQQPYVAPAPQQPVVQHTPVVARPQVQGELFSMEKISQNKKDWVVLQIVIDEKSAKLMRIGKALVVQ